MSAERTNSRRMSLTQLFEKTASVRTLKRQALHCEYPMYVVSLDVLLTETRMRPHEEMMADGKLREWDKSMEGHTIVRAAIENNGHRKQCDT